MEKTLKLVGYEQSRDIVANRDASSDKVLSLEPVKGSEKFFVRLELPDSTVVRAQVTEADFDRLRPMLGLGPAA